MSRTLAALITFMLGAPVVAFVAAGVAAGINPSIYSGAVAFLAGVLFLMGFVYEIQRLASTSSGDLVNGWMPKPPVAAPTSVGIEAHGESDRNRVEVVRDAPQGAVADASVVSLPGTKAA
jgi:hypothetical protein